MAYRKDFGCTWFLPLKFKETEIDFYLLLTHCIMSSYIPVHLHFFPHITKSDHVTFLLKILLQPGASQVAQRCRIHVPSSVPGWARSPAEGNSNLLQYSCLGNPMDRGARWATVHGVARVRHDLVIKQQQQLLAASHFIMVKATGGLQSPIRSAFHSIFWLTC